MYEIQLFGPIEVRTRGVLLTRRDLGGDRQRHILALLALRGALSVAELAELLFEHRPPRDYPTVVAREVALLRRRLDPAATGRGVLVERAGGYRLDADRVRTDVARFDELVTAAAWRTPDRALPPLTAAAHLAALPLLADEVSPAWVPPAREGFRHRLVASLLGAGEHALAMGRPGTALQFAARAVAAQPAAERAWYLSMAAHRATGDRPAAWRAYELYRRRFVAGSRAEMPSAIHAELLELLAGNAGVADQVQLGPANEK